MTVRTTENIQLMQQYGLVSPEWATKAMRRAAAFEAQLLDIAVNVEISFDQVREEVEKYARENPVTLEQAASVVAGRILRR